jgi:hypothetical protein
LNDEDRLLIDQLTSEYRIIQDKIDKIGSFRFTVRGWSVTLVIASIFATSSSATVSPYLLLLLIVFVWLFFVLEREQNKFGFVFGGRAIQIEKDVRRIIRGNSENGKIRRDIGQTPQIALHLHNAAQNSAPSGRFLTVKRWAKNTDHLFYTAQIIVIIATVVFLTVARSRTPETALQSPVSIIVHEGSALAAPEISHDKESTSSTTANAKKKTTRANR